SRACRRHSPGTRSGSPRRSRHPTRPSPNPQYREPNLELRDLVNSVADSGTNPYLARWDEPMLPLIASPVALELVGHGRHGGGAVRQAYARAVAADPLRADRPLRPARPAREPRRPRPRTAAP